MQDMSGYVLPDIILPPLDEHLDTTHSIAQTENDIYVQNSGLPSPAEFVLGDNNEGLLSEDSNMFYNSNRDALNPTSKGCQPESPIKRNRYDYILADQIITTTKMADGEQILPSCNISSSLLKTKLAATNIKEKPHRYLAIFDSEEPLIKEDTDVLYCTQEKLDFDVKGDIDIAEVFYSEETSIKEDMDREYCSTDFKDMEVAEEVVVTTEEETKPDTLNLCGLDSVSDTVEDLDIPEEKVKTEPVVSFQLDPFSCLEDVMDNLFNDLDQTNDPLHISPNQLLYPASDVLSSSTSHQTPPSNNLRRSRTSHTPSSNNGPDNQTPLRPGSKHLPQLTLDIDAARAALLVDKGMSDTPELLEALKPEVGKFDLVKFITTSGDPNNNAISPSVEYIPKKPEGPRKGKSHLSLIDLKQAQNLSSRKSSLSVDDDSLPSTSETSPSGRPARKSATRFKRLIEEGLLSSPVDSQSVSSEDEDEDDVPKSKRRRLTSTSCSRRRLNSDSDRSSVSEDAMKYRERRDRNNLSSKRSRQKRKEQHKMKQQEMKELEEENTRLRLKAAELESVLTRVKAAWDDYLASLNKDNDKDGGDEHL